MSHNSEDEDSLQDNFFKQRQKIIKAGGFSRSHGLTWDRRCPKHHSNWLDRYGEKFFKIEQRYNFSHKPVPYSVDRVYSPNDVKYNAEKVRFDEDRKRHFSPSYSNTRPIKRYYKNTNISKYNRDAERGVNIESSKVNGHGYYHLKWKGYGSSARKITEMSKENGYDRSINRERRKWETVSSSHRFVRASDFDHSSEIKRRKLDKDCKDQKYFSYSRRIRNSSKSEEKGIENANHCNHDIENGKNNRIVTKFEGLRKLNVVVKAIYGKEAPRSESQKEDQIKNSTAEVLELTKHNLSTTNGKKIENNVIPVENMKTLTGLPDSKKKLSSTSLLKSTFGIQKKRSHSIQKKIESSSQIKEQSSVCVVKGKEDKVQLSKDKLNISITSNVKKLTAEDDKIVNLDAIVLTEKSNNISDHIELENLEKSKEEGEKTLNELNDNYRLHEAVHFNVLTSTNNGELQEKSSCLKMDGNNTELMHCGEQTKNCAENAVDNTNMDSSSTKIDRDESNEVKNNEQHPKHEKISESNTIAEKSVDDLRVLNIAKQRHIKSKKLKVNHKQLKCTIKSKKLKNAKQTLISSKLFKKVNKLSELELTAEEIRKSFRLKKFQDKKKKRINPTKRIRPNDAKKENVDVKSIGQDKLIEDCIEIQLVQKANLDVENTTLNKELNIPQGGTVLEAVQVEDLGLNRNLKVDDIENEEDEEEDYTIIDLNVDPATPSPWTPGLSANAAPLQEYEGCQVDKKKDSGLTSDSVYNMQTPVTECKGHSVRLLQFQYNPDTSDISDDDNGEKCLLKGGSHMNIDDFTSSAQNSLKNEVKEEFQEDAIKAKFKRQQPNKEERRMRMERLEEAYMQLATDATNSKENERSVSKKKRKVQHYETKQKSQSEINISLDKTADKRKSKSKTKSSYKCKYIRNGELPKTVDEIKDSLMSSQSVHTSKDNKNGIDIRASNSLIRLETDEKQQRKDEGSLDSIYAEGSSKNANNMFFSESNDTSEKVVSNMKDVNHIESSQPRHSPVQVAVPDHRATLNNSYDRTDVDKSVTSAERSDALAHHQIWQNGFEFIHDLILMDGRKITTKGHIEPKLMKMKERKMIRCQVCEKYMTPRSFMYHHDNFNIIKQIDVKRSVSNLPKPYPEDIIIWNSGAGEIWEYFLKEISIVNQHGINRLTTGNSYDKESLQAARQPSGISTSTLIFGENVHFPLSNDQRPVSMGNAADNLQISSSYALGYIAVPAATLMYSNGSAYSNQIISGQAEENILRERPEKSNPFRSVISQQSLKNLKNNPLATKSGLTVQHHVSDNINFNSRPNASRGIVQDAYNCNLQKHVCLQSSGSENQIMQESLTAIRHKQMQNQLGIASTNSSFSSATSSSDEREDFRNSPNKELGEDAVAACTGHDLAVSQAQKCHQAAADGIKQVAVSSCHHKSIPSSIKTPIYCAQSPGETRVCNGSSSLFDRAGDQSGDHFLSQDSLKDSCQPLSSFEIYTIPSASSLDTRSHLSTCFMQTRKELSSDTTINDSEIPSNDTAAVCRKTFGSQEAETLVHSSNNLYNPPRTKNQLAISSANCTLVDNQPVPIKKNLPNKMSEMHLAAGCQLSVSSASKDSKENALSTGFATGFETSSDQIASSETEKIPSVNKSSTSQNSSEEASSENLNNKKLETKAGPSYNTVKAYAKTICALDNLIDEIDFRSIADLEPFLMLAKKLEIKCMHEMLARSRKNQALVAELSLKVQSLQPTDDNGKSQSLR